MKTDFYTKTILTIIAFSLTIIALKDVNIINEAKAENNNNTFKKNNTTDVIHVVVDEVDAYAFSYCTVPVKIKQ